MENAAAAERVGGQAEEAVHLRGVQHHGHDVGGSGGFEQVGHQAGGDGDARGVLFVGAGEGEIGDDGVRFGGRGAAGDVEHHQQFDQVVVDRLRERLHDVDLAVAHGRAQLHEQVVVAETRDVRLFERDAQAFGDIACQLRVGTTAEEAYFGRVDGVVWSFEILLDGNFILRRTAANFANSVNSHYEVFTIFALWDYTGIYSNLYPSISTYGCQSL